MNTLTITRNLRDATIIFSDGSSAAETLSLALDEGNLEATTTPITPINVRDRGILSHVRTGDQEAITLSLGGMFTQYFGPGASGGLTTLGELARPTGPAAELSWSSTSTTGEPFMFTVALLLVNPGTIETETITYTRVVPTSLVFAEGDEFNTFRLEGTAFILEPTITSSSTA